MMAGSDAPLSRITFICGDRDSGKTTRLWREIERLRTIDGVRIGGFATTPVDPGLPKDRYVLQDLATGEARLLMSELEFPHSIAFGRFFVDPAVFSWANSKIMEQIAIATHIVFDEIGRIELSGGGLAPSFSAAVASRGENILAAVRTSFLGEVGRTFGVDAAACTIIECFRQ